MLLICRTTIHHNAAGHDANISSGTIDAEGNLEIRMTATDTEGSCEVTIDLLLTVNLSRSPTNATYAGPVSSKSCPVNIDCRVQITGRWTRTSAALRASGTVRRALRAALAPPIP